MRVFLTGATGHIGSAVFDALLRAGHQVIALVRNGENAAWVSARGGQPVVGDLGRPDTYCEAATDLDGYIHTADDRSSQAVHRDRLTVETLIDRARGSHRAFFIYTSGIWVLGSTREPATEEATVNPIPYVAWRPAHEHLVLEAGRDGVRPVIVRPGLVYGGARGVVADLLKDAGNGLIRVIGPGENHWPLVYDRDLADLFVRLAGEPDAAGIFHANDEGDERVNDLVEAISMATPRRRPDVRHVPLTEARAKLGGYADALALDQIVRSPRARALGWRPLLKSVARNVPRLFEEWRSGQEAA